MAITTAWYTVALEHGSKDMPKLEELIGDRTATPEQTRDEYHKRLRQMGLE